MDFYRALSRYYDEIFPMKPVQKAFLQNYLHHRDIHSMLDVGCATGSYTMAISEQGIKTAGIDLSAEMIELARKRGVAESSGAEFFVLNMLDLGSFKGEFDGIICLGNTFAHLITDEQLEQALNLFKQKAGRLLIQVVNYDRIIAKQVTELPEIKTPNLKFSRLYRHLPEGLIEFSMQIELFGENRMLRAANQLCLLTKSRLVELFERTGWQAVAWWGSYAGENWSEDSPATIVDAAAV